MAKPKPLGKTIVRLADEFGVKVVGVSFVEGYPDNVYELEQAAADRYLLDGSGDLDDPGEPAPLPARLERVPDNEVDPNAVAVHVPLLRSGTRIGYLPAGIAQRLAPLMDAGEQWSCEVVKVLVHPDNPGNPGIDIRCRRGGEQEGVPDDG